MKKIIFLAHDPGGMDVIWPVYRMFSDLCEYEVELLLVGPAGIRMPYYNIDVEAVRERLIALYDRKCDFILVTGTSWNSTVETESIKWCKEKGIITISVLDYWSNYKERFQLGEDADDYIFPNYYLVMDDLAVKEAVECGVDRSIIKVVGHPGLDSFIEKKQVLPMQKKNKILFLCQPIQAWYGDSLGFTEHKAFSDVLKLGTERGIAVHIKFHPKETEEVCILYQEYSVDGVLAEMVWDYDVVIGMNTVGLLQCAIMGMPVISYEPDMRGEDICITNKLGITQGAFSYNALVKQFNEIKDVGHVNYPFWIDGRSTERCVVEIIKICSGIK